MVTNTTKEQFYSPTKKVRDLWKHTRRTYVGVVANRAKDLGVAQRSLSTKSLLRTKRIAMVKGKAQRVKTLKKWKGFQDYYHTHQSPHECPVRMRSRPTYAPKYPTDASRRCSGPQP